MSFSYSMAIIERYTSILLSENAQACVTCVGRTLESLACFGWWYNLVICDSDNEQILTMGSWSPFITFHHLSNISMFYDVLWCFMMFYDVLMFCFEFQQLPPLNYLVRFFVNLVASEPPSLRNTTQLPLKLEDISESWGFPILPQGHNMVYFFACLYNSQ